MFMCFAYFLSIANNSNNIENINHIGSITLQDVADGCFVSVPSKTVFKKIWLF